MPYCKKSTREQIYIDYKSGMSRPDICKKYNLSYGTVCTAIKTENKKPAEKDIFKTELSKSLRDKGVNEKLACRISNWAADLMGVKSIEELEDLYHDLELTDRYGRNNFVKFKDSAKKRFFTVNGKTYESKLALCRFGKKSYEALQKLFGDYKDPGPSTEYVNGWNDALTSVMEHINEMPSVKGNLIYKYCYANLKKGEEKNA